MYARLREAIGKMLCMLIVRFVGPCRAGIRALRMQRGGTWKEEIECRAREGQEHWQLELGKLGMLGVKEPI